MHISHSKILLGGPPDATRLDRREVVKLPGGIGSGAIIAYQ
jgi:hypothetical protein